MTKKGREKDQEKECSEDVSERMNMWGELANGKAWGPGLGKGWWLVALDYGYRNVRVSTEGFEGASKGTSRKSEDQRIKRNIGFDFDSRVSRIAKTPTV